jgi:DNA ligase (NAD+)
VIDKLRSFGVNTTEPGAGAAASAPAGSAVTAGAEQASMSQLDQTLAGRSVVVTGTLEGYSREEAEEAIISRGGKSPGTVSSKTWAVVVGSEPGAAKLRKAEELGIPVIDGSLFAELLATGELPS